MGKITIVGLGPGGEEHLTIAIYEAMKKHNNIYLRTEKHPVVSYLKQEGINFKTFDYAYNKYEDFQEVYEHIASSVLEEAKKGDILYAVPGHPYVAESTVQLIVEGCKREGIERVVYPAMSFVDAMFMALEIDPVDGFQLIDGLQLDKQKPDPNIDNIITQVYDPFIASEIKLKLMNHYDDEQEIYVVKAAGVPNLQKIVKIPLFELDRLDWIDYLTTIFIKKVENCEKKYYNMNNLVQIMERLRSKEGCPWDIKQTHQSLKPYLIEESNEVLEAIDEEDDSSLEEELGDVLLQVIFHSQIAKERGAFQIEDVIRGICEKLIFRHPHVFGGQSADTVEDVAKIWAEQKMKEKHMKNK
ncbi:MazG family protein [Alkaliphilus sp. B6464]|uniref:MazG family protein n=1 Tax=Alkaliphilus sp. B6464 TaxID=2731219 RepID=UPI001BAD8D50|nr:MazG family protein [Alkaliphilus sp. B6464]QUH19173.1 MazG family protein [Alkaliphilus sp. B6464]